MVVHYTRHLYSLACLNTSSVKGFYWLRRKIAKFFKHFEDIQKDTNCFKTFVPIVFISSSFLHNPKFLLLLIKHIIWLLICLPIKNIITKLNTSLVFVTQSYSAVPKDYYTKFSTLLYYENSEETRVSINYS